MFVKLSRELRLRKSGADPKTAIDGTELGSLLQAKVPAGGRPPHPGPVSDETWLPLWGDNYGYWVSSWGRVLSEHVKGHPVYIKRPSPKKTGHLSIRLEDGWWGVHRLVAAAFRAPGEGPFVLHYDDNPANNYIENLRWGTAKENSVDALRNGTRIKGSRCGAARLSEMDAYAIRALWAADLRADYIAGLYPQVSKTSIYRVLSGEHWGHVETQ